MVKNLMPREETHSIITLNTHQAKTLAMLCDKHDGELAHIYQQRKTKIVSVEFTFPHAYIIATNGRAIGDHA